MIETVLEWIRAHDTLMWWLGASSAGMFIGSLIAVPYVVARIPHDYFMHEDRELWSQDAGRRSQSLMILKNALGCVFLLAGLAMLVLPGQGALTMVVGLMLLNFPGKYKLERWFVSRSPISRGMNWMRRRHGAVELEIPHNGA